MSWGGCQRYRSFLESQRETVRCNSEQWVRGGSKKKGVPARNRHRSGMTYTLRLLLGLGLRDLSSDSEYIKIKDERVHLFDLFAWVNFLRCSALKLNDDNKVLSTDISSKTMQKNCARHLRVALEILEPNVIVAQGTSKWLAANGFSNNQGQLEQIEVNGSSCLLLNFCHPSGGPKGWGNAPDNQYLQKSAAYYSACP